MFGQEAEGARTALLGHSSTGPVCAYFVLLVCEDFEFWMYGCVRCGVDIGGVVCV